MPMRYDTPKFSNATFCTYNATQARHYDKLYTFRLTPLPKCVPKMIMSHPVLACLHHENITISSIQIMLPMFYKV